MTKYIYVNRDNVVDNASDGGDRPVITVLDGGLSYDFHGVEILGPSRVVYKPNGVLRRGYETRVWVETESEIEVTK